MKNLKVFLKKKSFFRYLRVQNCFASKENEPIAFPFYKKVVISHTGPLYRDSVTFQWKAPIQGDLVPLIVQFYYTLALPGDKAWTNLYAGTMYLI